jgi:hypothetical protein
VTPSAVAVKGSVYEQTDYLRASAAHVGAEIELVRAGGAVMPLLRYPDGHWRTVYGLPRPFGDDVEQGLGDLARDLTEPVVRLEAVLSPLGTGPDFARQLSVRGGRLTGERQICVVDLDGPAEPVFDRRARRAITTAAKRGATVTVSLLADWFGPFYRAAMAALAAEPIYFFGDEYFAALSGVDHYVVTVEDAYGVAAAALFLTDGTEAYYHLGGRRVAPAPEPVLGAMSVALAEGILEARRAGCGVAVLGGGRTDRADDSLLLFKRQLATGVLPRFSVKVGDGGRR